MANAEFWRGRRVFVTGANGFIAAWLTRALVDKGARVTGYDRSDVGALDLHGDLKSKVALVLGDLTDGPLIVRTLREREIETVYHLAAQSSIAIA